MHARVGFNPTVFCTTFKDTVCVAWPSADAGEKLCEKPFDILFEATWMPAPPGTIFEDRPPSPERLAAAASSNGATGAAGSAGAAGGAAPKGAYRCVLLCLMAAVLCWLVSLSSPKHTAATSYDSWS